MKTIEGYWATSQDGKLSYFFVESVCLGRTQLCPDGYWGWARKNKDAEYKASPCRFETSQQAQDWVERAVNS